jgi:hypothetical protein
MNPIGIGVVSHGMPLFQIFTPSQLLVTIEND